MIEAVRDLAECRSPYNLRTPVLLMLYHSKGTILCFLNPKLLDPFHLTCCVRQLRFLTVQSQGDAF